MKKSSKEEIREQLAGLGSGSIRKSYYQQLQKKKEALEIQNRKLQEEIKLRKKAEESLRKINEELEDRVEQRTRELKQMQAAVVHAEKLRSATQLLIGLSHEINTPLGNALTSVTYNNYLLEILPLENDNDFKGALSDIKQNNILTQQSVESAIEIVEKLREIFAVHEDQRKRVFDVKEFLNRSIHNMDFMILHQNIKVTIDVEKDLKMDSYPGILNSIVTELIQNSIKHGMSIKGNLEIVIECFKKDSQFYLTYKDNGKGVDEENIEKLFDPFFTTAMSSNTNGLGLYVVYNLAQKLGGPVTCKNIASGGLRFDFMFKA